MKPSFVLDCSMTMAWCFADETTPAAAGVQDRLENETALVPAHWFLEIANVLAMSEKRRRISTAKATEFVALLSVFDIEVDREAESRAFLHVLPLARNTGLTVYDATYLDLAMRTSLPLATLDVDLRAGAKSVGVELLGA